jgi:hypothetical protein
MFHSKSLNQGSICFYHYAMTLAKVAKLRAGIEWMDFDLIDGRDDTRFRV